MTNRLAAAGLLVGLAGGVAAGVALGISGIAGAQTPAPSTTTPAANAAPTSPGTGGAFKPNENTSHETAESADREAAEDSGQVPGPGRHAAVMGGSNETPGHESGESSTREADEGNNAPSSPAPTTPSSPAPTTPPTTAVPAAPGI